MNVFKKTSRNTKREEERRDKAIGLKEAELGGGFGNLGRPVRSEGAECGLDREHIRCEVF